MTPTETLKSIRENAPLCWTCGGEPNPENFGGLCDPCDIKRKQRLHRSARILEEHGQTNTQEYRALQHLGY